MIVRKSCLNHYYIFFSKNCSNDFLIQIISIIYSNKIFFIGINNPKTTMKEPICKSPSSSSSFHRGPQSASGSPSRPTPDS